MHGIFLQKMKMKMTTKSRVIKKKKKEAFVSVFCKFLFGRDGGIFCEM